MAGLRQLWERARASRWPDRVRRLGLVTAIVAGGVYFGNLVHGHYAIGDWLAWRYLLCWTYALFFLAACTSTGHLIVQRVAPRLPLRESLALSVATGVYVFYALMFLGGIAHVYTKTFAIVMPAAMLVAGAESLWRRGRRVVRHLRAARARGVRPLPLVAWPAALLGIACVIGLYVAILSPRVASFDTVWYHLGLGQQYRALGGISPSPEGWFVDALPQLASTLYAWAFFLPGCDLFNTVEVAAHMEFVLFLATLACLPLLVRRLVPGAHAAASWAALFLFPALFVYDASLSIGNDHIAAFWGPPIFLALRRAWRRLEPRYMLLLALLASSALLTKYQASSLVAGPALAVAGRAVWLAVRKRPAPWGRGLVVALVAGLLLTTPHWLKNLAWYGDPLYPALHKHLEPHPWNADAPGHVEWNWSRLVKRPKGTLAERIEETVRGGFAFSFRTHARKDFHGSWPIFGSLFTLSLLWLPFLERTRRVWALYACTQLGVFVWYWLSHVERYLQALVPWMAAAVAATLVLVWREGWPARIAVAAMVALQALWGSDAYFLPTHWSMGDAPVRATAELAASGFKKKVASRNDFAGSLQSVGRSLPEGSRVLLHEHNPRLGLRVPIVTDMPGFQGLISYGLMESERELDDLYRRLGLTHLVMRNKARALDTIAGDLRYWGYVERWAGPKKRHGSLLVTTMPPEPPEGELPNRALYLSCHGFEAGVHPLSSLHVRDRGLRGKVKAESPLGRTPSDILAQAETVGYIVYDRQCKHQAPEGLFDAFVHAGDRRRDQLWVRKAR